MTQKKSFDQILEEAGEQSKQVLDRTVTPEGDLVASEATIPILAVEMSLANANNLLVMSVIGKLVEYTEGINRAHGVTEEVDAEVRAQLEDVQREFAANHDILRYMIDGIAYQLGLSEERIVTIAAMMQFKCDGMDHDQNMRDFEQKLREGYDGGTSDPAARG